MLAKGTITDFEERIKHQRDLIRHGDYQHLGMLSVISLDKEKDQRLPLAQAKERDSYARRAVQNHRGGGRAAQGVAQPGRR